MSGLLVGTTLKPHLIIKSREFATVLAKLLPSSEFS